MTTEQDDLSGVVFFFGKDKKSGIVSPEDADLAQLPWGKSNSYAMGCRDNGYKEKLMHRVILERKIGRKLSRWELADHKNNHRWDNRRSNLRLSSNSTNQANRTRPVDNTSGYKGVQLNKQYQRLGRKKIYTSKITVNGKVICIGHFSSPEQAAIAYNEEAVKYFGEFARLNIIKEN